MLVANKKSTERCKNKSKIAATEACAATCADGDADADWWYAKKAKKDCSWVAKNAGKRCKTKDKIKAEDACCAC